MLCLKGTIGFGDMGASQNTEAIGTPRICRDHKRILVVWGLGLRGLDTGMFVRNTPIESRSGSRIPVSVPKHQNLRSWSRTWRSPKIACSSPLKYILSGPRLT